jgi:hypothetical protein
MSSRAVAYSAPTGSKGGKLSARIAGSCCAGIFEIGVFHPVDTTTKRLMTNETINLWEGSLAQNLKTVIFKDAVEASFMAKWASLFPGLGFATSYKMLQRIYKFGGQPFVKDFLASNFSSQFESMFGRDGKSWMHATAGCVIGLGEVVLLPLDVLKIKAQTNPEVLSGRGVVDIFMKEGRSLYKGTLWTMARNAPGSFSLFGASAFVKERIFKLEDYGKATFFQNFCASFAGGVASILVSAPLDTIKTRIQAQEFSSKKGGFTVIKEMFQTEGPFALFKGLTPKVTAVGPKLIFSFTIAQSLIGWFESKWA